MDQQLLTHREALMAQYRQDCITPGQRISVQQNDAVQHGTALDILSDGALLVRFDDGNEAAVNSGEVSIRGMYGYI